MTLLIKKILQVFLFFLPFLLFLSIGFPLFYLENVYAQFYEGHADGWHWYNDNSEIIDDERNERNAESQNPVKQMNALKATIEHALDAAILYPTETNVKNYISLQNKFSNQATLFANMWQKVLLENPGLDYSLIHPTNSLGRQVDLDLQRKKEDAAIAKLASESGLFFFYRSSCLYCQKFAPIVKNFASRYKIAVIPITLDGVSLPEFPKSRVDQGQALKFNVTVEPSLFAVNPYSRKAYPVSYGLVSEESLRKRILDISQNFRGDL